MESRLGTAEWEDLDVFADKRAYEPGDFWLGRSPKNGEPIGHVDDRHIFLASKNRSGKGTTTIVNNLLTWEGSVVVVDPKGENATVTAGRRGSGSEYCEGMGQRVYVLDPFGASSVDQRYQASFNPLDALDPECSSVIDDAGLIADAMIPERPDSKDPYFDLSARKMLKGLILHVITAPHFDGRRNLLTVRELIRHGERAGLEQIKKMRAAADNTDTKPKPLPSAFHLLWADVAANNALEGIIAGIGESIANSAIEASKTFDNCLSTLDRHTEFLDSFEMRNVLERSDFQLADLKTDPDGVSLYLCLPQRYSAEHYRWLRLMNTLVITMMEEVKGQPATGHRVLMVLDEFLLLEHMKIIERAVSYIAGYGLTMFFIVQSLEHLKKIYNETWETLIANCGIKMFYAVGDHFSRKYISEMIGETEVIREAESTSEQQGTNESETHGENRSQTEGVNESTAEGKSSSQGKTEQTSKTHGTSESVSDAVSESRGWNEGESRSKSWGKQRSTSHGSSDNESEGYTPSKLLFRNTERHFHLLRENETKNLSSGSSKGNTFGKNWGGSKSKSSGSSGSKSLSRTTTGGQSFSQTSGSSQSVTDSESFTHTRGQSASETSGTSESTTKGKSHTTGLTRNQTVHKRPLITADEIGRWFARPDPGSDDPAWGLVIIDDANPAVVHRTEYFNDLFFGWLFDPHPDHALPAKLMGESNILPPSVIQDLADFSKIHWTRELGSFIRRGNEIAVVDLPGPKDLVEVEYLQYAHDVPQMEHIRLDAGLVTLPICSTESGTLHQYEFESGTSLGEHDSMGRLSGNNRQWLLESAIENDVHSLVEEYSLYCERLMECETEGKQNYAQQQAQLQAAKERRRQAELDLQRAQLEAEEARQANEKRVRERKERELAEAAERSRRDAEDRAVLVACPKPRWIDEDVFVSLGTVIGLLIGAPILAYFELHWIPTIFLLWIITVMAIGFSVEGLLEVITSWHKNRAALHWETLGSLERTNRVDRELSGYNIADAEATTEQKRITYAEKHTGKCLWIFGFMGFVFGGMSAIRAWSGEGRIGGGFADRLNAAVYGLIPAVVAAFLVGALVDLLIAKIRSQQWAAQQPEALERKAKVRERHLERQRAAKAALEKKKEQKKRERIRVDKRVGSKPALFGMLGFAASLAALALMYNRSGEFDFLADGLTISVFSTIGGLWFYVCTLLYLNRH